MTVHLPSTRRICAAAACAGLVVFATACSVSVGSSEVKKPGDVAIGKCLTIDRSTGENTIKASTSECDNTTELTFYAAETIPASAECSGSNSAYLTFPNGTDQLCITPNFVADSCYQVPTTGGKLIDYRQVDCSAKAAPKTVIAKVRARGTADIECSGEQTKWTFTKPTSIGYCLQEATA
jgi:hypothetical protein